MLLVLKALQSLVKTLHSDGTPTQIAAGFALGAVLGLSPLMSLHNLVIFAVLALLNVSFGAGLLAMAVFTPLGFVLDPVFDRVGHWLLTDVPALHALWVSVDSTPVLAFANFTNTVVLGSIVGWLVLAVPVFIGMRIFVVYYRSTLGARVRQMRIYHAVVGSKAYNVYRWFRP